MVLSFALVFGGVPVITYLITSWNGMLISGAVDYVPLGEDDFYNGTGKNFNSDPINTSSIFLAENLAYGKWEYTDQWDLIVWNQTDLNDMIISTGENEYYYHGLWFITNFTIEDLIEHSYYTWRFRLNVNITTLFQFVCIDKSDGPDINDYSVLYEKEISGSFNKTLTLDLLDLLTIKAEKGNCIIGMALRSWEIWDNDPFETGDLVQWSFEIYDPVDAVYMDQSLVWQIWAGVGGVLMCYIALASSPLHQPFDKYHPGPFDRWISRQIRKRRRR
jgi:hypothetical protein